MRRAAGWLVLAACSSSTTPYGLGFHREQLDPRFAAEGITSFDVNHDGYIDLVTEQAWYSGPDFVAHEIAFPEIFDAEHGYSHSFGVFHLDIDHDGYDDLISFGLPDTFVKWCQNPRGQPIDWPCFIINPDEFEESPTLTTAIDGKPRMIMGVGNPRVIGWMQPGSDPQQAWTVNAITPPDFSPTNHGMGIGDIDGDGRADLLTGEGWFSQADAWAFHPTGWCPDNCSHLYTYDFDGDGKADVIGASPHNYGTWWWHQEADGTFTQHEIDTSISENHSARLVDLDGDGIPEWLTGKRYWAHFDRDAGAFDPILLVAYKFHREGGAVVWNRTVLDEGAGVGSHQLEVTDVDGDGRPDIVVATRKGVFLFRHD